MAMQLDKFTKRIIELYTSNGQIQYVKYVS